MFAVSQKIVVTRQSLQRWQSSVFGSRPKAIEDTRRQLQNLLASPSSPIVEQSRKVLASNLNSLMSQDHEYWKQRSRVLWLSEGDRNTKFFHTKASTRRRSNLLKGLFDRHGVWQDSEVGIENVVTSYFSYMFSAGTYDLDHMSTVVDLIPTCVTEAMNSDLCAPYSGEEIKCALFQMHPNTAPGPDGMPPLFYQCYWDTLGSDIILAVQNFLHTGQLLKEINYTHICLIPKN